MEPLSHGGTIIGGDSSSVSDQMGSIASISSLASSSAPQLSSPNEISFEGTKDVSTFSPVTGTLIGVDPDSDQLIYGISGGSISLGKSISSGQYGTLSVDLATGLWTYTPNNTAIKSLASSAKDTFEITVTDGIEMDSKDLIVNVSDVNDPATITTEDGTIKEGGAAISGTATHTDIDANNDDNTFTVVANLGSTEGYGTYSVYCSRCMGLIH